MNISRRLWSVLALAPVYMLLLVSGCKDVPVDIPNIDIPLPDFSLNCPGVTEHAAMVDTFLVIGHRGAARLEPENTIRSMQRAMEEGANGIETDLCMTSDGEIVLWHDWNPNDAIALAREQGGEAGMLVRPRFPAFGSDYRRPVDEMTLEEFRTNFWYTGKNLLQKERWDVEVPTLQQFMEWAHDRDDLYYVFLDIKIPDSKSHLAETMIAKVDSIIASYNPRFHWVYLSPRRSVWDVIARLISGDGVSFDVDLGSGLVDGDACSISSSHYASERGSGFATTVHPFDWTETPWTTLKRLLMCDLERRDNPEAGHPVVDKVIAATINDGDKQECLIDMGVDGLMTDDPAVLRALAVARGKTVR